MDILCSDKTGTLTEGIVRLHSAVDVEGSSSDKVLFCAYLIASFETGFANPIDEAIRARKAFELAGYRKQDEIPYDFLRKRLSILMAHEGSHLMVTKGAVPKVLDVCSSVETAGGAVVDIGSTRGRILERFEEFSRKGFRTLGVASRDLGSESSIGKHHEAGMTFLVVVATLGLPFTPVARLFGFRPLPVSFVLPLAGIVALYVIAAEVAKRHYYGTEQAPPNLSARRIRGK